MSHLLPEYHSFDEFKNRMRLLEEIKALGIDPYPPAFKQTHLSLQLHHEYKEVETDFESAEKGNSPEVKCAGRLVLFRAMGKNAFGHIQDEKGRIQVLFNRDNTQVEGLIGDSITPIKFIEKKLSLGDIIGVEGHLFYTQKQELTIYVKKVTLLCKTLLPLADKHAGLEDKELRYRKRWLDLISHPEIKQTFLTRAHLLKIIRTYFDKHQFIEVETPVLQNVYGGANARPFKTTLNALDQEMFLRISLEIPLKKLIVGGFAKVYEISKVFRNEGIDKTHNPEFTMLEAYATYWDYNDMMHFVEHLYETICLTLFEDTKIAIKHGGETVTIDLKTPWQRMTMKEAIKMYAKIDCDALSDAQLKKALKEQTNLDPQEIEKATRGGNIAQAFEELAEKHLIQPHHITDHPIETTPLCKPHRNTEDRQAGLVERFESFILATECCNAYTELNDPVLQRKLLVEQNILKESGDMEAHPLDEEFIEAVCQGMPPTSGVGIGIDRLVMLFTNSISIRDVLFFPLMKSHN
jgi:lysyl-tRNA synthetase class 2